MKVPSNAPGSIIPNSSRSLESGGTSQEPPPKIVYEAWTDFCQRQLFDWLELPGNYEKWKCAGIRTPIGSSKTSALTKKAVTSLISIYLETVNVRKNPEQVMNKMRYVEKKFKEAEDYMRSTGGGITNTDEKLEITKIQKKVISICPFYYQVKSFMAESVSVNPLFLGESGMEENFTEMLFGRKTGIAHNDSIGEDEVGHSFEEENSSASAEQDLEDNIFGQYDMPSQPASTGTKNNLQVLGFALYL